MTRITNRNLLGVLLFTSVFAFLISYVVDNELAVYQLEQAHHIVATVVLSVLIYFIFVKIFSFLLRD